MKYDLFADFYLKSGDAKPRYTAYLGSIAPVSDNELEEQRFYYSPNDGFADYVMDNVDEETLSQYAREGYLSEVMDILYNDEDFERICLNAMAVEVIDDDGNYPPRGVLIGNTFAEFDQTDPYSEVRLTEDFFNKSVREKRYFRAPLQRLKNYFEVLTQSEVITKFQTFQEDTQHEWTFDELQDLFESDIDNAVEIASKAFFGQKDLDGNPAILHALAVGIAGGTKYEKMTGFLHDVLEDSEFTWNDLYNKFCIPAEVCVAVNILTHDKERVSYEDYIAGILASGNQIAINVKLNDLKHNIHRAKMGNHPEYLKKHLDALTYMEKVLKSGENE